MEHVDFGEPIDKRYSYGKKCMWIRDKIDI